MVHFFPITGAETQNLAVIYNIFLSLILISTPFSKSSQFHLLVVLEFIYGLASTYLFSLIFLSHFFHISALSPYIPYFLSLQGS